MHGIGAIHSRPKAGDSHAFAKLICRAHKTSSGALRLFGVAGASLAQMSLFVTEFSIIRRPTPPDAVACRLRAARIRIRSVRSRGVARHVGCFEGFTFAPGASRSGVSGVCSSGLDHHGVCWQVASGCACRALRWADTLPLSALHTAFAAVRSLVTSGWFTRRGRPAHKPAVHAATSGEAFRVAEPTSKTMLPYEGEDDAAVRGRIWRPPVATAHVHKYSQHWRRLGNGAPLHCRALLVLVRCGGLRQHTSGTLEECISYGRADCIHLAPFVGHRGI